LEVPGARFSRAIGHVAAQQLGVNLGVQSHHIEIDDVALMKLKFLILSSQLQFISENKKFREIFVNFKFAVEDLKGQIIAVMKGLEKSEQINFEDYGLIYSYQN